jgi:hypothetical protein
VDFNAGVVAAGEAQIESTVTGNTWTGGGGSHEDGDENNHAMHNVGGSDGVGGASDKDKDAKACQAKQQRLESTSKKKKLFALRDQSQVFLPINNALSGAGHVHGFLQELGQGVQVVQRWSKMGEILCRW